MAGIRCGYGKKSIVDSRKIIGEKEDNYLFCFVLSLDSSGKPYVDGTFLSGLIISTNIYSFVFDQRKFFVYDTS